MKKNKIFIACDSSNTKKIKKIIYQLKKSRISMIPKFGMQFFYSKKGRSFLENFKGDYWLDLKICDVPNTALAEYQASPNYPVTDCPLCRTGIPITTF